MGGSRPNGNGSSRFRERKSEALGSGVHPLPLQFTYWVGGLMVEHLKVLGSGSS